LASSAVIQDLVAVSVYDVDLSLTTKNGGTTSGLFLVLDALLLDVVPILGLWALVLAPLAVAGAALQVLLTAVGRGGLMVHVLSMALGVWSCVSLGTLGRSRVTLTTAALAVSQGSSVATLLLLRGGR